jgi:hypothetical protein
MASGDLDPEAMLSVLSEGGVCFILIGGMAAVLHGDLDVTFCPSGTSGFADLKRDAIDIQAADRP